MIFLWNVHINISYYSRYKNDNLLLKSLSVRTTDNTCSTLKKMYYHVINLLTLHIDFNLT